MKKIFVLSILLFIAFAVWGQNVTVYQVPPDSDTSNNRYCSIASNSRGDILIIYRNNLRGMKYFFKKSNAANGTIGEIPEPYSDASGAKMKWMSVRATWDNVFHAGWCQDIPHNDGLWYASFNPSTEAWTTPENVAGGQIEDVGMRVSPLNGDLALIWDWYTGGAKYVYAKFKMGGTGPWTNQQAVAPKWTTNAMASFDEEGYLYVAWKQDGAVEADLNPCFSLLKKDTDGNYKYLGKVIVSAVPGWHFLPSVAAVYRKGFMACVNENAREFRYLPFERNGDSIITDVSKLEKITNSPGRWEFSSMAMPFGEEILYSYKAPDTSIKMLRYKDGAWTSDPPLDLNNGMASNWLYDSQEDPNIGVLTVWATYTEPNRIFYSIWDNPIMKVKNAVLKGTPQKTMLRSFFRMRWIYVIKWENNPFNVEKQVVVTQFNVYRRNAGSSNAWTQIGSVPFDSETTEFGYADKDVTAASNFEYCVTCVDDEDNESKPK